MPSLRIDFDADAVEAVLSVDQPGRYWDVIVRTCREYSDEAELRSGSELRMPWWAFLGIRKAIGYQVIQGDIDLAPTESATEQLTKANERSAQLGAAARVDDVSEAKLNAALAKNGFVRPFKWFQHRNLLRLCRLPVGADFSVPGAGKTTEALAYFSYYRQLDSRLLVVAPKNAFAAWEEQFRLCLPEEEQTFIRLIGGRAGVRKRLAKAPVFMLVTYEQFPIVADILTAYLGKHHCFLFLDESHRIKSGIYGVRANAILRVSQVANHRLVLSGTPLPNAQSDLVPQLTFLAPELDIVEDDVVQQIQPFFVRTTKTDLELPKPQRFFFPVKMGESQRHLYELLRSEAAREATQYLSRDAKRAFRRVGRSATRLLQYVSNPALLIGKIPEFDEYLGAAIEEGDSPKLRHACLRARQLARQGKKVIIWSSFVENVELIAERLADIGADYIHGGVEASTDAEADSREAKVARFHDDKSAMVLVANPAACSEGISLHTVCHHALYIDRNYNAAQYLQSEDRIHRIGSDEQKIVEIIVCPDTVDDSVARRLQAKIDQMGEALNDADLRVSPISLDADKADLDHDDILDLIGHLSRNVELAA